MENSGPNLLIVITPMDNLGSINFKAIIHPVVRQIAICLGHKKGTLGAKILLTT